MPRRTTVEHNALLCATAVLIACLSGAVAAAGSMQWQLIDPGNPQQGVSSHLLRLPGALEPTIWLRIENQFTVAEPWILRNDAWERRLEEGPPEPLFKAALVYDPVRDLTVRFGGFDKFALPTSETWEYDGSNWVLRADVGTPPARGRASIAYDSGRGVIVLFGGLGANNVELNDLWEYDGVSWTQVIPPLPHPLPRDDASMEYDAARGRIVMAFGRSAAVGTMSDTWEYDGVNWIFPLAQGALPRYAAGTAYDEIRQRIYVFGGESTGETAFWDGQNWNAVATPASPPPRFECSMTFDPTRGESLLYGGSGPLGDLWRFDGTTWVEIPSGAGAQQRSHSGLAFDPSVGRGVAYGGFDHNNGGHFDRTWEWDGTGWQEIQPLGGPGFRHGHRMAYDPADGRSVLFGGWDTTIQARLNDTWRYDGTIQEWSEQITGLPPPARSEYAMAYSAAHGGIVVFAGQAGQNRLNDTWVLENGVWRELQPVTKPSDREGPAMAYDALRSQIVVYGGFRSGSGLSDTWLLIGEEWTESSATGPGIRVGQRMAYDAVRNVSVLVGGAADTDSTEFTWEFDGTNWTPVSTRYSPDMRRRFADIAWDSVREVTMFTAGRSRGSSSAYNDTWAYGWDDDDDGSVGGYDNCPGLANADQTDADLDGAGDVCDCAVLDPGSFAPPVEVANLAVSGNDLTWDDQAAQVGSGVVYDLATGGIGDLRGAGTFDLTQCLAPGLSTPAYTDARTPPAGDGFYYLARAQNTCGAGTYGTGRASLDAVSPCP